MFQHLTPSLRALIFVAAASLVLGACAAPRQVEQSGSEPPAAPQQALEEAPMVSMDYQEGRFGATQKKAAEYCAGEFQRQAVAVRIDKEAKVATFACNLPL